MKTKSKAVASKKASGGVLETVKTVVYAVLIALVVRTVAYEPFNIPSGSMVPTLLVGDYLFVSKFSYGYSRYSLPFGLPLFSGRICCRSRICRSAATSRSSNCRPIKSTDYIKRIVGLPGDHIQVRHGNLYINEQLVPRKRRSRTTSTRRAARRSCCSAIHRDAAERPGEPPWSIVIIKIGNNGPLDNTPVYEVPPGHYFAMGDNRDNSQDSRVLSAVGYVPAENLVGKAQFIFFSTDGSARWWEIWKWPIAVRYSRLFRGVG